MNLFLWFGLFFFFLGCLILFFLFLVTKKNSFHFEKNIHPNPSFAILIPARNESLVIERLLQSIMKQSMKVLMKDVYVIIETKEDSTYQICNKYGVSVIVRRHLERKSKGYALAEGIEEIIQQGKKYDAYFIFDADNVLDENFILEMNQDYQKGYAISTGYRNVLNGNDSIVSASAGLIYTFINEWLNKNGSKNLKNVMLSGTGFYISGKYIHEWKTYPFHTLTEDVELSYYATLYGLSTNYNSNAIFYDEQPNTFSQSVKQRKRWIKGFFQNWFCFIPKCYRKLTVGASNIGSLISMMCSILIVICFVLSILIFLFYFIFSDFILAMLFILAIYLFLALFTAILLWKEGEKLKINKKRRTQSIFYHPIFLVSYVFVFLLVIFDRNITWEPIQHGKN